MSRVSCESGLLIIIQEGLGRNSYYYHESNLCTANTYHTISTLVQGDIGQANLYKKYNTILKRWHNAYVRNRKQYGGKK